MQSQVTIQETVASGSGGGYQPKPRKRRREAAAPHGRTPHLTSPQRLSPVRACVPLPSGPQPALRDCVGAGVRRGASDRQTPVDGRTHVTRVLITEAIHERPVKRFGQTIPRTARLARSLVVSAGGSDQRVPRGWPDGCMHQVLVGSRPGGRRIPASPGKHRVACRI